MRSRQRILRILFNPRNTRPLISSNRHIIAEKHSGETVESNLALSCSICNKNKGSDIASIDPETDEVVRLYNPRKDSWENHFQLQTESGTIEPLTAMVE
jgi:5-methylcytosine-specific restriction endonuclease McrA